MAVVTVPVLLCMHLGDTSQLHQTLAGPEVCVLVRLGLGRKGAVGSPEVDEGLHRLKLMGLEHVQRGSGEDEVAEATVERLLKVQVVEGLDEVGPVEVSVDAEHLAEDGLAHLDEVLREAGPLADPIGLARVRKLRERRCSDGRIVRIGDARRISRENVGVVGLARDPSLHKSHVFIGGEFDGLPAAVQPSKRVISVSC